MPRSSGDSQQQQHGKQYVAKAVHATALQQPSS